MKPTKTTLLLAIVAAFWSCKPTDTPNQETMHQTTETYDYEPIIETNEEGKAIVTIQNYQRAETHYFMKGRVDDGMFGKVFIMDQPTTADNQKVVRANGDVLFCYSILDLNEPATLTLPESNGRFMELRVFNEDHYLKTLDYSPGEYHFTKENMNTRYIHIAIRILADVNSSEDLLEAQNLQKAIKLEQKDAGTFEIPDWDQVSLENVRKGIQATSYNLTSSRLMFGDIDEVDHRLHLSGTALGWGGAPEKAAKYLSVVPDKNDGVTPYVLKVKDNVPVDGFWSISVYNKDGYFEKNAADIYTRNNVSSQKDEDGYITIHLGGDPNASNYIPICDGWNYTIRMYRSRSEILDGTFIFPEADMDSK